MNTNIDPVERMISAVSYLWVLFFLPPVLIPRSGFGRFHANQALLNLLWGVVFAVVGAMNPWNAGYEGSSTPKNALPKCVGAPLTESRRSY